MAPANRRTTMSEFLKQTVGRRAVLGAGLTGVSMLAMPSILRAQDKSLKVGV
jgi:putative spermidine/putrescine transport system substrate-binding protein